MSNKIQSPNIKKIRDVIFILILGFILFPGLASAAVLYLEPAEGEYYQGEVFIVEARIDTEEECINTVEANLIFSQDILEVVDFSKGNSILTFWVKPPIIDQNSGLISFAGGIPGGYCGVLPGDPEISNLFGKIIFKVREVSGEQFSAKVEFLDNSRVLLNDGFGTPAKLTIKGARFTILPEKLGVPKDEWQEELEKDKIPPEPFEIEINQDPSIFEGKYFIFFSTTDKQTGVDHFEIKEGKRDLERVVSPYLLEDQSLSKKITVRAYDKAGNYREAEIKPPYKITWRDGLCLFLILIGIGVIWWILKKTKK